MNILKWFNKWLTPEEEERLNDPGRRIFFMGGIATVALLVVPLPEESLEVVSYRDMKIPLQLVPGGNLSYPDDGTLGRGMSESQIIATELERIEPLIPTLFERDAQFYKAIKRKGF